MLARGDLEAVGSGLDEPVAERDGMLVGAITGGSNITPEALSDLEALKENTVEPEELLLGILMLVLLGELEGSGGAMGEPLAVRERLPVPDGDLLVELEAVFVGVGVTVELVVVADVALCVAVTEAEAERLAVVVLLGVAAAVTEPLCDADEVVELVSE